MAASLRMAGMILFGIVLVTYLMVWTPMALLMLFIFEAPKNWIGWSVIILNPALFTLIAILIQRDRQRRMLK